MGVVPSSWVVPNVSTACHSGPCIATAVIIVPVTRRPCVSHGKVFSGAPVSVGECVRRDVLRRRGTGWRSVDPPVSLCVSLISTGGPVSARHPCPHSTSGGGLGSVRVSHPSGSQLGRRPPPGSSWRLRSEGGRLHLHGGPCPDLYRPFPPCLSDDGGENG